MVFCNFEDVEVTSFLELVTILILIDGFLQLQALNCLIPLLNCHNPYFNRWFSAISGCSCIQKLKVSHNPYFNRWFSAILNGALIIICI